MSEHLKVLNARRDHLHEEITAMKRKKQAGAGGSILDSQLKMAIAECNAITAVLGENEQLRSRLLDVEAHADWLWGELRSAGTPERFWKDQPAAVRSRYMCSAKARLVEQGVFPAKDET